MKQPPMLEFRVFLKKLLRAKGWSYETLARKMATPEDLLQRRVKQLEHFFNDPENGCPRASLALAVQRALGVSLEAEDYGWDPEQP